MAKRRTEGTPPRGAPRPMQSPPDQQAVDSAQVLTPRDGSNVGLPQTPARGAARRHSQEATQPARSTPSRKQRETPPRLCQMQTQPMEWTPTSTKDNGTTGKTPPRHSQENTQQAPTQLTELYAQYRERCNQEEKVIDELLIQYQQIGEDQPAASSTDNLPQVMVTESSAQYQRTGECHMAHIIDAAQLTHHISSAEDADMQPSHTTTKHWRQMQQMGGQYPGPLPNQQTQVRCLHYVRQPVHGKRTTSTAVGKP